MSDLQQQFHEVVDKAKAYDNLLKMQGKFDTLHCSFCGKNQHQVQKLIAGPNVYICDECVNLCVEIIDDSNKEKEMESKTDGLYE